MMNIKKTVNFFIVFQVVAVVSSEPGQSYEASATPTASSLANSSEDKKNYQFQYYTLKNQNDCSDCCEAFCADLILFFTRFNMTMSI